jgi:hypothetical protein
MYGMIHWLRLIPLCVALCLLLTHAFHTAHAAVVRPFTVRFTVNDTSDFTIIGNTLSSCNTAATACVNARNGVGSSDALNDNSYPMVYVDVDNDATTFNSSTANLELPPESTVLWAGLYWGGDVVNGTANTGTARLRTPATSGYQSITSATLSTIPSQGAGNTRYHAFADITTLVQTGGAGTYTLANVLSTPGVVDRYTAWSMVVVYKNRSLPPRNVTIFDGYAYVTSSDAAVDVPVSGFLTPLSGAVNVKIGTVTYEGDLGYIGDSLRLNIPP